MRYRVTRYHKIGNTEYQPGQVLEIDDPDYAAWLNRDMRGGLEEIVEIPPAPEPEPEPVRAIEKPPRDRMVRRRKTR